MKAALTLAKSIVIASYHAVQDPEVTLTNNIYHNKAQQKAYIVWFWSALLWLYCSFFNWFWLITYPYCKPRKHKATTWPRCMRIMVSQITDKLCFWKPVVQTYIKYTITTQSLATNSPAPGPRPLTCGVSSKCLGTRSYEIRHVTSVGKFKCFSLQLVLVQQRNFRLQITIAR